MAQQFFHQKPDTNQEIFSDTLDGVNVRVYKERCPDLDMEGRFHVKYEFIDVRDANRPVLINQDVIYNPRYFEEGFDGHYLPDVINDVLQDFVESMREANAAAETYDSWVRGLYTMPAMRFAITAMAVDMAMNEEVTKPMLPVGGSHDEPLADMLGKFDLNSLFD